MNEKREEVTARKWRIRERESEKGNKEGCRKTG